MSIDNLEGGENNVQTSEEFETRESQVESGKRKRGRPLGSRGKEKGTPAQFRNYNPKKWEAWMEAVVMESVCGKSNGEIGERYGYSSQHISNILSSPKGREVASEIVGRIKGGQRDLALKLEGIRDKALARVSSFIDNDSYATASPFMFAKIAIDAFKLTNAPEVGGGVQVNNNTQNNILVANPEILARMTRGLEVANEARLLNSPEVVVEVVETSPANSQKLKVG